ncbi:MAG: hypothetical protein KKB50_16310 [Planctomycetes bacterium]|nr:hypothetical protein [Planctomycetota bacterium]
MSGHRMAALAAVVGLLAGGTSAQAAGGAGFYHICCWETYDAGFHGVGTDPDGYAGAAFDGRYVYFAPQNNGTSFHGEVLRYDASGDFKDVASWATFDPGAQGVGDNPVGFWGAVFDGRYVYFVPNRNDSGYHGEVLRYDTTGAFADVASWAAYDPGANGVGDDPDGYNAATFDGRYIYFSPYHNGTSQHGEVLRYDTTGDFASAGSWITYDAGAHGVGVEYGYCGAVFDGRYVYFVPNCTSDTSHHGEVRRYDTTGDFTNVASWAAYDPGANGVGDDPDGYVGGVFDGRYVYFVPYWDEPTQHGQVLRLDTTGDFFSTAAWAAFDPGSNGVGDDPDGYIGGVFDGRFVYFVPCHNGTIYHAEVLRYDISGDFLDAQSWDTFDPRDYGIGRGGYNEGVFDGRYVYFVPNNWTSPHGQVLRYDTAIDLGDLNCDGTLNGFDIDVFVLVLNSAEPYDDYYALYPDCDHTFADVNADGLINGFDIDAFVALMAGG